MNEDLLERAAASVRERYDGHSASSARTERLVLDRLAPRAKRRQWLPLGLVPLVATFLALAASAAWGTSSGKLVAALHAVSQALNLSQAPTPTSRAKSAPSAAGEAAARAPLEPAASAPEIPEPEPTPTHAAPMRTPMSRTIPLATSAPSSTKVAAPDPNALFRAANHAQFAGHDPAAALELWEHYLSAAPNGSLAPEARYNRAIDLVQLSRKAEARAALEPFARGDYGTYRQTEAQQLLGVLGQSP